MTHSRFELFYSKYIHVSHCFSGAKSNRFTTSSRNEISPFECEHFFFLQQNDRHKVQIEISWAQNHDFKATLTSPSLQNSGRPASLNTVHITQSYHKWFRLASSLFEEKTFKPTLSISYFYLKKKKSLVKFKKVDKSNPTTWFKLHYSKK